MRENGEKALNNTAATNISINEISVEPPTVVEAREQSWNDELDPEVIGVVTRARSKSQTEPGGE